MKRLFLSVSAFTLGLVLLGPSVIHADKAADNKKDEKMDVTTQVRENNSSKYSSPPTQFRQGHASPREFDEKAIASTAAGFTIQLPSKAPVPTPTFYQGKIYISGGFHSKEYYCFDAITGKKIWAVDVDDDGPTSAVIEEDICVFNTESCTIFALDARTGKHLWSYWLGDPLTSTPTIAKGKVFTSYPANGGGGVNPNQNLEPLKPQAVPPPQAKRPPACSHVLACFDLKTGKIEWQRWIDSDVMSAPVAVGNELFCTSFAGTVYKFQQNDGAVLSASNSRATSAPVVVGNNVYLTQRADTAKDAKPTERIAGIDKNQGKANFASVQNPASYLDAEIQAQSKLGETSKKLDASNGFSGGAPTSANPQAAQSNIGYFNVSSMQAFQGSRILNYGESNFNCMGDEVLCTDPTNGKTKWNLKLTGDLKKEGGHLAAPPAAAGGHVFLATLKGEILQVDPDKGTVTKKYTVAGPLRSQPAIVDGRIYVGTVDGKVSCVDTGDRNLTGWTTWGGNSAHTNAVERSSK